MNPPTSGRTDPDDVGDAPVNPVSRRGDLWLLGKHQVLCGDATSAEDVVRLLGPSKPHCDDHRGLGRLPARVLRQLGPVQLGRVEAAVPGDDQACLVDQQCRRPPPFPHGECDLPDLLGGVDTGVAGRGLWAGRKAAVKSNASLGWQWRARPQSISPVIAGLCSMARRSCPMPRYGGTLALNTPVTPEDVG